MTDLTKPRESWGTRIGVILAVTGSAVGLGNFLRFPGLAAKYGSGAFMIPYVLGLLILGLPLALAEWAMGRYGGRCGHNSSPGIYRAVCKWDGAAYFGVVSMMVPIIIYMYYVFIEAWCLGYAWYYATGTMPATDGEAFGGFLDTFFGLAGDGAVFRNPLESALIFVIICFIINFLLIYRGLTKGIEWFCQWAMPALIVLAVVVLVRVLTLGSPEQSVSSEHSVLTGLGYMWNPAGQAGSFWKSLTNAEMWLAATSQIFFSLSVGFGIVITYASYLKPDDDIALSSLTAAAGNEFCEVALGGMMIIPAAFIFLGSGGIAESLESVFRLGFITLPRVFDHMIGGRIFGFLFFFLLFLAAVTSSLSMLQPAIALLEQGIGLGRKVSVAMLSFITAVGTGFVIYFTNELYALDTLDFWVGTFLIFLLAGFQAILFGWVLGPKLGLAEIDRGAEVRIPRVVGFILRYISPIYLLVIFGFWVSVNAPDRIRAISLHIWNEETKEYVYNENAMGIPLSIGLIVLVAILFTFFVSISISRWRRQEQAETEVSP